jgi:beta-glucosidase
MVELAGAQQAQKPAYLDPSLPAEQRAADLVSRMTLEEKATQLVNQARAVPRLNIPAYDWWSEALHGVAVNGTTEFPEPIGLGATFDPDGIHQMAEAIGVEGRIKHAQDVAAGHSNIFEGLDFWAPNINIFRDPRWGRGQETYGEDPYLTSRMGVAYVTGLQGDDPKYYRAISTPKHFAVHSGPEPTRHTVDVKVSKHDELDTYLPAFRAAVTEGHAGSVMCAYNSINGQPACANDFLLKDQLRDKWEFRGYVVSDCEAVIDIYKGHHYKPTQAESSAISLKTGMDNECVDFMAKVSDDHDYKPYLDAVAQGFLKENDIDIALTRLFTARIKLGMFDPPEMVPYNKIDESELNSQAHHDLARKLAEESMVLLKNDGVLPLGTSGIKIAVIGPLASQTRVLLGNYTGIPKHTVSILEGLKAEFPAATITYVPGTTFLNKDTSPVPNELFAIDGKQAVKVTYSIGDARSGSSPRQLTTRMEHGINAGADNLPIEVAGMRPLVMQWETTFTPTTSGDYNLGMIANGRFHVSLDGKDVASGRGSSTQEAKLGHVQLEQGKSYALTVEYRQGQDPDPVAQLVWSKEDLKPSPEAIAAARNADVVIAVVGITSELEGEEMQVNEEGFKGGDRTSLDLPKPEQALLEALAATGKKLVVVLLNGSALGVNWARQNANAILEAWYPGEEGGSAVAATLSGRVNPAGRLPVTFYKDISQLPPFEDYSMKGRTYRYFDGAPLYTFGYGLSYTKFSYKDLAISTDKVQAGSPVAVDVTVTNNGKRAGDEVVQLYLEFPDNPGAPRIALRAFKRIHLEIGDSQKVRFLLDKREMGIVTDAGQPVVAAGSYSVTVGGGLPSSGLPTLTREFSVKGSLALPE